MKVICNKKEFADLVVTCDRSGCGNCVLEAFCEREAMKLGDVDKQEGFISLCDIEEGNG